MMPRSLFFHFLICFFLLAWDISLLAKVQDFSKNVQTLESLVSLWVDLKKEVAEEERDRKKQKQAMVEEYAILFKEKSFLLKEITPNNPIHSDGPKKYGHLIQKKKTLKRKRQKILFCLSQIKNDFKQWFSLLPKPLQLSIQPSLIQLEFSKEKDL